MMRLSHPKLYQSLSTLISRLSNLLLIFSLLLLFNIFFITCHTHIQRNQVSNHLVFRLFFCLFYCPHTPFLTDLFCFAMLIFVCLFICLIQYIKLLPSNRVKKYIFRGKKTVQSLHLVYKIDNNSVQKQINNQKGLSSSSTLFYPELSLVKNIPEDQFSKFKMIPVPS